MQTPKPFEPPDMDCAWGTHPYLLITQAFTSVQLFSDTSLPLLAEQFIPDIA